MRLTEDEASRVIDSLLYDLNRDREVLISIYETCGFSGGSKSPVGDTVITLTDTALIKLQLLKDLLAKSDAPSLNAEGEALIDAWVELAAALRGASPNDD